MNEAAAFYESRVVGLGEEFLAEVNACVERILERPKIGRRLRGDIRRLLVTRFPYSVVYATHGETAVVQCDTGRSTSSPASTTAPDTGNSRQSLTQVGVMEGTPMPPCLQSVRNSAARLASFDVAPYARIPLRSRKNVAHTRLTGDSTRSGHIMRTVARLLTPAAKRISAGMRTALCAIDLDHRARWREHRPPRLTDHRPCSRPIPALHPGL